MDISKKVTFEVIDSYRAGDAAGTIGDFGTGIGEGFLTSKYGEKRVEVSAEISMYQ